MLTVPIGEKKKPEHFIGIRKSKGTYRYLQFAAAKFYLTSINCKEKWKSSFHPPGWFVTDWKISALPAQNLLGSGQETDSRNCSDNGGLLLSTVFQHAWISRKHLAYYTCLFQLLWCTLRHQGEHRIQSALLLRGHSPFLHDWAALHCYRKIIPVWDTAEYWLSTNRYPDTAGWGRFLLFLRTPSSVSAAGAESASAFWRIREAAHQLASEIFRLFCRSCCSLYSTKNRHQITPLLHNLLKKQSQAYQVLYWSFMSKVRC